MSSIIIGGSDEFIFFSFGWDEDEGDLLVESEDEIDKLIMYVEGVIFGWWRNLLFFIFVVLYLWKEVSWIFVGLVKKLI